MFTSERVWSCAAIILCGACASGAVDTAAMRVPGPRLGDALTAEDLRHWDTSIPPSGAGLPPGSGTAKQGAAVYAAKCQSCHGEKGRGKPADALVGGIGTLTSKAPVRTVGSYWPYATTLFDYLRRAMPIDAPMTMSNDEVYAVTAYILYANDIIGENEVMNAQTLPTVRMPNRDGFINAWLPRR